MGHISIATGLKKYVTFCAHKVVKIGKNAA